MPGGCAVQSSSVPTGDDDGQVVEPGGYRYFGAARELPGVKQLFFQQQSEGITTFPPESSDLEGHPGTGA